MLSKNLPFLQPYKSAIDDSKLTLLNKDDTFSLEYHQEAERLSSEIAKIDLEERKRIINALSEEKDPKMFKMIVENELESINGMLNQIT